MLLQLENTLNDLNLSSCGLETAEGRPVIHDEAGGEHIRTSVDGSGAQWDLQQVRQLVELLHGGLGVNQASVVVKGAVGAYKHVVGDCRAEDLHAEGVLDELLGLFVEVGVDQRHEVITGDAVAQSRQLFLDPLDLDALWQTIPDIPELMILSGIGNQQPLLISLINENIVPAVVLPTILVPPIVPLMTGM